MVGHQYGADSLSVSFHTLPTLMHYEIVALLGFIFLSTYLTVFNQKLNPRGKKSSQLGLLKCLLYCEKFWLQEIGMFFKTYHFIKICLSSVILQNQLDQKKCRINSDPIMEAELHATHTSPQLCGNCNQAKCCKM